MVWRASRQTWRVRLDGRDFSLGRDEAEARDAYDDLIRSWLANGRRLPSGPACETVFDLADRYTRHVLTTYVKRGKPTQHALTIRSALQLLERGGFADGAIDEFRPADLKAFRAWLADDEHQRWNRTTINVYASMVVSMFAWAVEEELAPPDRWQALRAVRPLRKGRPARSGGRVPREKGQVRRVDADRVVEILDHCPPPVAGMLALQLLTGMRPIEAVGLRTRDIEPIDVTGDDGRLRTVHVYTVADDFNKTAHTTAPAKLIALDDDAMAVVRAHWITSEPAAYVFSPARAERARNDAKRAARTTPRYGRSRSRKPTPAGRAGDRYTVDSYRRAVTRACDAVHDPDGSRVAAGDTSHRFTPGQIRHTRATSAVEVLGIYGVKRLLGHADVRTTERYVESDKVAVARNALRLADATRGSAG